MDVTFTLLAKDGKPVWKNPEDLFKYLMEHDGQEIYVELTALSKKSEKLRLYAFIFGPLMRAAVEAYTNAGWAGIDKVRVRYMLQAEFAKEDMVNEITGEVQTIYEDIGGMTKARLLKWAVDICFHLETKFNQQIPDSVEWKMRQSSLAGRDYNRIK
jgi:hypothetical protein